MAKVFKSTKDINHEYCATICKVGEVMPIEGSDFLGKVVIAGYTMVIRKDEVKEGETVIYCPIETTLNSEFLSANNLYEISEHWHNANHEIVDKLLKEDKKDEAKKLVGFFNKHGRVRMVRLRGVESMGFIIKPSDLLNWKPSLDLSNIDSYVGEDFDEVDGELFIKVYMPPTKEIRINDGQRHNRKRQKKLKSFDKIIPGTFFFHYDTQPLNKTIEKFSPNDVVTISEKMDGTSFILAYIPVKRKLSFFEKIEDILKIKKINKTKYDIIYSSRNVIKNRYINPGKKHDFYDVDIWKDISDKFGTYVEKDMTVYGECIGYVTGKETLIQKKGGHLYTYGCNVGENKIMIYRITVKKDDEIYEYNVSEIQQWVDNILKNHPELKNYLINLNVFYHGTLKDLYPDLDVTLHWHENLLEKLKNEKRFLMECDEPLCPKGTPSEGIVIRIDDDVNTEAFKLKCVRYLSAEAKDIDKGIVDQESLMNYSYEEK